MGLRELHEIQSRDLNEFAVDYKRQLINATRNSPKGEEWRTSAWKTLNATVLEDGYCMREGTPAGIAAYAVSFTILTQYLRDYVDPKEIKRVLAMADDDLKAFKWAQQANREVFKEPYTVYERTIMSSSVSFVNIAMSNLILQRPI